jgi:hypothetical protein
MAEVSTLGAGEIGRVDGASPGLGVAVAEAKASMLSSCIAFYTYNKDVQQVFFSINT